ncbi:hypothetical protein SHLI107390_00930 [Shewanella livingstonensis]
MVYRQNSADLYNNIHFNLVLYLCRNDIVIHCCVIKINIACQRGRGIDLTFRFTIDCSSTVYLHIVVDMECGQDFNRWQDIMVIIVFLSGLNRHFGIH